MLLKISAFLTGLSLLGLAAGATPVAPLAVIAGSPDKAAVASIKAGSHDCPHCDLRGADLTNTCVKSGNVEGARFDDAKLVLMCMSFANFKGASFRGADMASANL